MCPAPGEAVRLLPVVPRCQGRSGGKPQVPGLSRLEEVGQLICDGATGHTGRYADRSSQVIAKLFLQKSYVKKGFLNTGRESLFTNNVIL